MPLKFPLTRDDIISAFPPDVPLPQQLTDSYADAVTDTEPFRNLRWTEVPANLLRRKFEAVFFFSPEAFHYYFPAFIWLSNTHFKVVDLPVDYLLSCLRKPDDPSRIEWRKARWDRFTAQQWELIGKWIE